MKIIDNNKKAFFDYEILEKFEAGIALIGSEVKSLRLGNVNLKDSFCFIENGEIILKNCHISPYTKGSFFNVDPRRDRKLLLHKREIVRLSAKVKEKGLTLVPLKIYFQGQFIKVEIALGRGKHTFDKRETLKRRDIEMDVKRQLKEI